MMERQTDAAPEGAWHALDPKDALAVLGATEAGLAGFEAADRLRRFGPNVLPTRAGPAWWRIGLRQFASPLILILVVAALLSVAIGHTTDAAFIGAVVLINAIIGGFQEFKAERSARALQALLRTRASVVRDGEVREMDAGEVVPGDVVVLESGDRVPADVRLLRAMRLEVDESLLTGESEPVAKDASWIGAERTPLAERRNMAFAGSMAARGRARGVVVGTGTRTEVGRLAVGVRGARAGKPPLLLRMERFTRAVGVGVLGAAGAIVVMGVTIQHEGVGSMILFGIALAVSAIPEGLPIAITIALAVAAGRMARRGVIVRRLGAVEGLGSCTLIASDKTGTLTCNELTVREILLAGGRSLRVDGQGFEPVGEVRDDGSALRRGDDGALDALTRVAVLCNEADLERREGGWTWRGDPTDVALLTMARKLGWARDALEEALPLVNRIPFEPEHRYAATFHRDAGAVRVFAKGAPERILSMCFPVESGAWAHHFGEAESLAERGLRVLAFADGLADVALDESVAPPEPSGLTLRGFVGMIDPLRAGVREAVEACAGAGVRVCMVTGDHPSTALTIARELGLARSEREVLTGDRLGALDEGALAGELGRTSVFARVAPEQKLEIVRAAQRAGHFVAVTGDGVNDAPALRRANIGVAMGRGGTDVAREVADLVISDDNLATIVAGIEEGRVAYDNIRKVVYLLVSTGAAEVALVMLAVASASPLPLLPVQLLWLNLVTNGIQDVALAFEPGEEDILRRRPRPPGERVFNRPMIEGCLVSALVMGVGAFLAFRWLHALGWEIGAARNGTLLLMVLFETVQIGNARSETRSALTISPLRSPLLLACAAGALMIHVIAMHVPLARTVLGTAPVGAGSWLAFAGVALVLLIAVELHKAIRLRPAARRRGGNKEMSIYFS